MRDVNDEGCGEFKFLFAVLDGPGEWWTHCTATHTSGGLLHPQWSYVHRPTVNFKLKDNKHLVQVKLIPPEVA